MSIFGGKDGQAMSVDSLSDEALETAEDVSVSISDDEERQDDQDQPQDDQDQDRIENTEDSQDSDEDEPVDTEEEATDDEGGTDEDEQTTDDADEAAAEEDPEGQTDEAVVELEQVKKNYSELRSWTSRVSNENHDLKAQVAELKAQLTTQNQTATAIDSLNLPSDPEELLQKIVEDPSILIKVAESRAETAAQKALEKVQQPIEQQKEVERQNQILRESYSEFSQLWQQMNTTEGRAAIIANMNEISIMEGNREAWKANPKLYMYEAAKRAFGLPGATKPAEKKLSQADLEAARKMGEKKKAEQLKRNNKAGKSVTPTANRKINNEKLSEEDAIVDGIVNAGTGGIFGG